MNMNRRSFLAGAATVAGVTLAARAQDSSRTYRACVIGDSKQGGYGHDMHLAFDLHDQITVVEEGDDYALFGWLLPSFNTPSISTTFPSALVPDMKFKAETNTHGERRAFVVTGNYESVLPMDLYPQELMKSILIGDFEKMEGLGLPELVEEDVALCEFVCVSKQPVQQILRQGLDTMREQA